MVADALRRTVTDPAKAHRAPRAVERILLGFAPCTQRPAIGGAMFWRSLPWGIALWPMWTVVADPIPVRGLVSTFVKFC